MKKKITISKLINFLLFFVLKPALKIAFYTQEQSERATTAEWRVSRTAWNKRSAQQKEPPLEVSIFSCFFLMSERSLWKLLVSSTKWGGREGCRCRSFSTKCWTISCETNSINTLCSFCLNFFWVLNFSRKIYKYVVIPAWS